MFDFNELELFCLKYILIVINDSMLIHSGNKNRFRSD